MAEGPPWQALRFAKGGRRVSTPAPSSPSSSEVEASFSHCREITRREARNFYYGLRLTPEPRRSAVYSIYAWMRYADDQVDEAADLATKRVRLASLREMTADALGGKVPTSDDGPSFWPAFVDTLARYPIDHAHLTAMLDGLAEDLDHAGYDSWESLDRYCYRVGSTVGLVCIRIWGLRPAASLAQAEELSTARGRAFQLTNILRDVARDFDDTPRRVYLPQSLLSAHGLSAESLRAWSGPAICSALMHHAAQRARDLYAQSAPLESLIDPACAPALWGMTQIYSRLLDVIDADPSAVFGTKRVSLSAARKGLIALTAAVRQRTGVWA